MIHRHPNIPTARVALSERDHQEQINKGIYLLDRGEPVAIPSDRLDTPEVWKDQRVWVEGKAGVMRPGVQLKPPGTDIHKRMLTWLRDHVNEEIPHWWYMATLGHDIHVTLRGDLFARHFHIGWANPLDPDKWDYPLDVAALSSHRIGFIEQLGWISGGKVTDVFVAETIDELVSTSGTEFADFDFHEVGTNSTAENNNDTALAATSGISRATGTPTDSTPIYQNVATITADASETWEEHGIFNNSSGASLMDRSLTGGQAVVSSDQVEYTYKLTLNPEA